MMRFILIILFSFLTSLMTQAIAAPKIGKVSETYIKNENEDSALVTFKEIVYNVPSTKKIGIIGQGQWCVNRVNYERDASMSKIENRMFINTFTEVLRDANYNIAGDPNSLFQVESVNAKFLVAAMIKDLEFDICYQQKFFGNDIVMIATNYMLIEWQVFDVDKNKIVFRKEVDGYFMQKEMVERGDAVALKNSFKTAVHNLLAEQEFHDLLLPKSAELTDPTFEQLSINYLSANADLEPRGLDTVAQSVVGISTGVSTGSGFIITPSGYILTNHHVIDGYDEVMVVFSNGMEVNATVVRSAKDRDVALLKVPLGRLNAVDINSVLPKVGSKAYAMGAPKGLEFQSTLSAGIISAMRNFNGLELIQSDISITNGNSGGPMFDENGHVVGISVSGSTIVDFANYFIPIESALDTLNIKIGSE